MHGGTRYRRPASADFPDTGRGEGGRIASPATMANGEPATPQQHPDEAPAPAARISKNAPAVEGDSAGIFCAAGLEPRKGGKPGRKRGRAGARVIVACCIYRVSPV